MNQTFEPDVAFEESANDLDLGMLTSVIYQRRFWILIPTVMTFLIVAVFVTVVKPRYTAEGSLLLENQESYLTRPQRSEVAETPEGADQELVGNQTQVVTSRDLARQAIEKLGLIGNPEFDPTAKGIGPIKRVLLLLGLAKDPTKTSREDRVIEAFEQRLSVFSPLKTRVLTVQFTSQDPKLAARAANTVMNLYLQTQSDAKRDVAKEAAASLAQQIADLKTKTMRAADDVERYRATSGLLAGANNMTLSAQQLADLNTELSRARTDEADGQAKAALIRDMLHQGRVAEVPDVANNDLIRRIAEQRVTARAQLALESGTLLPGHPRIKELNAEIANLETQLRAAAENIARALENNSKIAAARVANIQAAIDQQKTQVAAANTDEVHLHELERIAQAYRDQLDSSMTKYQEAVARENSSATPADARIIAEAIPPDEPSFPKKIPMLLFGTVAAFVLSLGAVVGRELLGGHREESVTEAPPLPREARITEKPVSAVERVKRFAASKAESNTASSEGAEEGEEPGEKIAARAGTSQGVHIVATRLHEGDKATAALIRFARNLARDGRPIMIDLDAKADQTAALTGPHEEKEKMPGLTDLLDGKASFADVIHRDQASRLHFVPFGSAEDFDPDSLDMIFDALAQTYDFVLLAAPPVSASEMPKALAPYADFVVLATSGPQDAAAVKIARDDLAKAGAAEVVIVGGVKEAA